MTMTTHPILDEIRNTASVRDNDLIGRGSAKLKEAIDGYINATASALGLLEVVRESLGRAINEIENGRIVDSVYLNDHRLAQQRLLKRSMLFDQICDWCWVLGIDRAALFAEIEAL